jgi:DNA-directed RNA polymerase II subunit RPB1
VIDKDTGEMKAKKDHYIIETDGVELKGVMSHPKIDHKIITSNSVREILTVLGVEAARMSLLREIKMVLGVYGIYINYRHLSTLCDIMTNKGILTAITRHGINRIDSGALRKCSFEETVEILLEAALHGETDPLSGITENIIMGQLAPYGTGAFDLMVDTDLIKTQATTSYLMQQKQQVGEEDLYNMIEEEGERTPLVMSPEAPLDGGQTSAWGGGHTPFGSFTPPGMSGADSEYTPTSPTNLDPYAPACPASPINNLVGGQSPYAAPGMVPAGSSQNYSPSSPAYPKPSYMGGGYAARSPAYQATSPAYQPGGFGGAYGAGTTPAYAPQSPARFGLPGGGTTPAYQGGFMGKAGPYGMSPTRGLGGISSPMYSPGGNPAYSPTQGMYGASYDEPAYSPGGYDAKKDQSSEQGCGNSNA